MCTTHPLRSFIMFIWNLDPPAPCIITVHRHPHVESHPSPQIKPPQIDFHNEALMFEFGVSRVLLVFAAIHVFRMVMAPRVRDSDVAETAISPHAV